MPARVASRKNSSKNLVRTAMLSAMRDIAPVDPVAPSWTSFKSSGCTSPVARPVRRSTPTALTSGSANGSLISGRSARLATARAAATIVAVAPTLDARSQASPSYLGEVIFCPYQHVFSLPRLIIRQYNKLLPLYASPDSRQPLLMAYAAHGKRVLITGASSGLGAALARQLATREAVVGLIARRRDRAGGRLG